MHLHLITAEDPLTIHARSRELIRFPQLTMPLLAALTPPQWQVSHTDEITHVVDTGQSYDLVGITAATPGALHAYEIADAFRARKIKVVMGGPHATLLPYEVAMHADIVVVGEAETLWPRVLSDVEQEVVYPPGRHIFDETTGANVEVLLHGSRIYRCPASASLNGLPHARRDLIRHGGWNKWWATKGAMIATRGCPHRCEYCTIPVLYPRASKMRLRPVGEVVAEVAAIPNKGIVFWDDNIGAHPRYAKELFRALAPLQKWWTSQTTMASIQDNEFLALAAASGCKALFMGLESVSQTSLDNTGKRHNKVSEYKDLLRRCHDFGIAIQAGIIFGFDEEDKDIFARTVDVMGNIGLDNATISLLVPYPGTPAHTKLQKEGRIIDPDWRHYNGKTHVVFRPRRMNPDELMAGYEWAKTHFYAPCHIAKRLNISRTGLWWNIPRNAGYMFGLNSEVRTRAAMHEQARRHSHGNNRANGICDEMSFPQAEHWEPSIERT
ncbi:MAG: B12-binding domain-containing radical SAM protein [Abitibacteriaceae bacterium]|nr:B12-binding domain-containing radical SAM protein [Abditibacteriaceae bacterium]